MTQCPWVVADVSMPMTQYPCLGAYVSVRMPQCLFLNTPDSAGRTLGAYL